MIISKRKYYWNFFIAMLVVGALMFIGAPIANRYLFHLPMIDDICRCAVIAEVIIIVAVIIINLIKHHGIRGYINSRTLILSIEDNLISIGAYIKPENKVFVELPKIKIKRGEIRISLKNLKIRKIIEQYLDLFSTALPDRYIVEDYYIAQNSSEVIIVYEDMRNYKPEEYALTDYISKIKALDLLTLYFDRKHTVNLRNYPHILVSGQSSSGKSYLANQLVIQAITKGFDVVILDVKRSYGLYKAYVDYCYEPEDIIAKLKAVENEMYSRMQKIQPVLDKDPNTLAVDIGIKPMLVVVEEYISLLSSLDKKSKEEVERIIKNLSVLARQSNIHMLMVMQAAGTENINATTRSNLNCKVLLGNAQSNIITATFGTGVDLPQHHSHMNKGEGLIQLDRITMLRVPYIEDIDRFNDVLGTMP